MNKNALLNFSLFIFSRKYRARLGEKIMELGSRCWSEKSPVAELKNTASGIIEENLIVFRLNSKSILIGNTTIAPFEKWGKKLRKVYRAQLSFILKEVKNNSHGLDGKDRAIVLASLRKEYEELAGKDNVFGRYPCRDGKIKIAIKLEDISKTMELVC